MPEVSSDNPATKYNFPALLSDKISIVPRGTF
jgi:hypothetical protein